jgi:hypothetical protein
MTKQLSLRSSDGVWQSMYQVSCDQTWMGLAELEVRGRAHVDGLAAVGLFVE